MEKQFKVITAEEYNYKVNGYLECHTTELISSNHFVDDSEKHIFLQTDRLIIFSKNSTGYDFIYTCEIKELNNN